ncbi:capsule biosynthesis protein [Paracoccus sp. Z118]|nr:capsule biosynthesis protein [Paracoccus sp. Z118]
MPVPAGPAANAPARRPAAQPPAGVRRLPPPTAPVRPPVGMARPRRRHWLAIVTFVLFVLLPAALWGWYLWTRAADQYTSSTSFSVRKEEGQGSLDILGGLTALGGSSGTASDTDILFEVIRSPDMVRRVSQQMDLVGAFTRAWPHDFVFAYDPSGMQEDLSEYWNRQVKVLLDSNAGIITVRANAFAPEDALQIAESVLGESEKIVNALSDKALSDATRLAEVQLNRTRDELVTARQDITSFRVRTQIVDPTADLGAQMAILGNLQAALTEQQVALDQLRENARAGDHRIVQAEQRIAAIQRQIEEERAKFSGTTEQGESYAQLMHEYERLAVDLEFAEGAHTAARVAYEAALQNAQRQSRYLAAHIQPALAESSLVPNRPWLLAMGFGLAFVLWSIAMLVFYSIRDRR